MDSETRGRKRAALKGWSKVRPSMSPLRGGLKSPGASEWQSPSSPLLLGQQGSRSSTPNCFVRPSTTPSKFDIVDVYSKTNIENGAHTGIPTVNKQPTTTLFLPSTFRPSERHEVDSASGRSPGLGSPGKKACTPCGKAPREFSLPPPARRRSVTPSTTQQPGWASTGGAYRLLATLDSHRSKNTYGNDDDLQQPTSRGVGQHAEGKPMEDAQSDEGRPKSVTHTQSYEPRRLRTDSVHSHASGDSEGGVSFEGSHLTSGEGGSYNQQPKSTLQPSQSLENSPVHTSIHSGGTGVQKRKEDAIAAASAARRRREVEKQDTAEQVGGSFLLYYAHRQELLTELRALVNQQLVRDRLSVCPTPNPQKEGVSKQQQQLGTAFNTQSSLLKPPIPVVTLMGKMMERSGGKPVAQVEDAGPGEMVFGMRRDTLDAHKANNDDYVRRWKRSKLIQENQSTKVHMKVLKRNKIPKCCTSMQPLKRMSVPIVGEFEAAKTYEEKKAALCKLPQSADEEFLQRSFEARNGKVRGTGKGSTGNRQSHSMMDLEWEENIEHRQHAAEARGSGSATVVDPGRLALGQVKVRTAQEEQKRNIALYRELVQEDQPTGYFPTRLAHLLQSIRTISLAAVKSYTYQRRLLLSVLRAQHRRRHRSSESRPGTASTTITLLRTDQDDRPDSASSVGFSPNVSTVSLAPGSPASAYGFSMSPTHFQHSTSPTNFHSSLLDGGRGGSGDKKPGTAGRSVVGPPRLLEERDSPQTLPADAYGRELLEVWPVDVGQVLAQCPLALELVGGHTCQGELFLDTAVATLRRGGHVAQSHTTSPRRAPTHSGHKPSQSASSRRLFRELQDLVRQ